MSEDLTKDLTAVEMLRLLLADVRDMKGRLSALETLVEDRFKDTRPMWQAINARTERMEQTLTDLKEQMRELAYSDVELKASQRQLFSRVTEIERQIE